MTISSDTARWSYSGNGSTDTFAYSTKIFANTDLDVYVDGTLKTLTTHYTVTGVGSAAGGSVVFEAAHIPASGTGNVVIVKDVPNTQTASLPRGGSLDTATLETALDRATIQIQQVNKKVTRTLRQMASDASDIGELPLKATRATKLLGFDANGDPTVTTNTLSTLDSATTQAAASASAAAASASSASSSASSASSSASAAASSAADAAASAASVANPVSAASTFGTDNVLVRSDGTSRGVQSTGITVADTTNDLSGVGNISAASTDAGAGEGPLLNLDRNSASPADNDLIGAVAFKGRDESGGTDTYAKVLAQIIDATGGTEDGLLALQTVIAGTLATRLTVGAGLFMAGATNGDKGAGTVNATEFYKNGAVLSSGIGSIALQIITADGTYTKPAGLVAALAIAVGGGGGGASGSLTDGGGGGGGGGSGGVGVRLLAAASIGATETVDIGAAGSAGSAGAATTFGSLLTGGAGSAGTAGSNNAGGAGGDGGIGSSGNLNVRGGAGQTGGTGDSVTPTGGNGGNGGSNLFGGGGKGGPSNTAGSTGGNYGAGGGGGGGKVSGAGAGGAGAPGVLFVLEFKSS